jgi:hypothetical protein
MEPSLGNGRMLAWALIFRAVPRKAFVEVATTAQQAEPDGGIAAFPSSATLLLLRSPVSHRCVICSLLRLGRHG